MSSDMVYYLWEKRQKDRGIDVEQVKNELKKFRVETASWAYGDSGTRFYVYKHRGVPRNLFEKIEDAAQVNKFTGIAPVMSIHIPWDRENDYLKVKEFAAERGIRIGAVNPNTFQEDDYVFGSVTNARPDVRKRAVNRMLECVEIAREVGSKSLNLWFGDGTNYPGQGDFRSRKNWLYESLIQVYEALDVDMTMLIEYKLFEPAFYHTDISDWGVAYALSLKLGDKAKVQVDLGHHPFGINVPYIVAFLLDECKMGGFHLNDNNCGDDDLIPGTINPYRLFLVYNEIISALTDPRTSQNTRMIAHMIDTSFCIEPKIPAMIRSVINVQAAYAKALLVNREMLLEAQLRNDVLGAEMILKEAFEVDITPLLAVVREENNLDPDPIKAYLKSGYEEKILERGVGGKAWL